MVGSASSGASDDPFLFSPAVSKGLFFSNAWAVTQHTMFDFLGLPLLSLAADFVARVLY